MDAAAMDVIREPGTFDVILTGSTFGGIVADELTELTGRGEVCPICIFSAFAMLLLRYSFGEADSADRIDHACQVLIGRRFSAKELYSPFYLSC